LSAPSGIAINFFMDELLQKIAPDRCPQGFQELFRLYGSLIKAMMMRQGAGDLRIDRLRRQAYQSLPALEAHL
jgi:hypothetical protein